MRILQVIPHYVPAVRFGGPQKVAHALGKTFVSLGHSVTVCTTNLQDEKSNLSEPLDTAVSVDGLTVYYEPVPMLRYWGYSPKLKNRIEEEIKRTDFVIVHAHYQYANWVGASIARKYNKPYAIFAHSSLHKSSISNRKNIVKKLYLRILEHKNLEKCAFVVFNAPEEKEQSYFSSRGKIVYSGIDLEEFSNLPPVGSFRKKYSLGSRRAILFIGRLDMQQKGLDLLIPAFAGFVAREPNVVLILAGPDENQGRAQVVALAKTYGILDKVILTGLLVGQEKLAAFQDVDAFILPSRFEGLSIALLEALYMGLPILTTNRVGLAEEIAREKLGFIVYPSVPEIEKGLAILMDKQNLAEIRGKGRKLILDRCNWLTIANDFLSEIEKFVQK